MSIASSYFNELTGRALKPKLSFFYRGDPIEDAPSTITAPSTGGYSQATGFNNGPIQQNVNLGDPLKGDQMPINDKLVNLLMPEHPAVTRLPNKLQPNSIEVSQPGLNTSTGTEGASMQQIKNRFNQIDRYTYGIKFAKGNGDRNDTRQVALNNFLNRFTEGSQNEYIY